MNKDPRSSYLHSNPPPTTKPPEPIKTKDKVMEHEIDLDTFAATARSAIQEARDYLDQSEFEQQKPGTVKFKLEKDGSYSLVWKAKFEYVGPPTSDSD